MRVRSHAIASTARSMNSFDFECQSPPVAGCAGAVQAAVGGVVTITCFSTSEIACR